MNINFFKKEKHFTKGDLRVNFNLYWQCAVFAAAIIIGVSFLFGYFTFKNVSAITKSSTDSAATTVPIASKDRTEKDLNYFSDREQKSTDIINSPVPITDPSL